MLNIKLNIQLFILLVLCGILIVCFVNIDKITNRQTNTQQNTQQNTKKVEGFQPNNTDITTTTTGPTTTTTSFELPKQIAEQAESATIINYKKQLVALFGAGVFYANNGKKTAYMNVLNVQTLPKTNPNDIVVNYFYFKNGAPNANSPARDQLIDYVLTEKQDRTRDFFLRADDGIQIEILFKYNFKNDFDDVVDVDAVVTEMMPTTRTLTDAEKSRYKTMTFNKCEIDYNTTSTDNTIINEYIKLTLKKTTIVNDYVPPMGVSGLDAINGTKEVLQEFIIYIKVQDLSKKLSGSGNTVQLTIADFRPYDSYLEYRVGMRIGSESTFTNYLTWQMYIKNASTDKINANDFLRDKLTIKKKELLHDKYNDIITPMFMVDNKIAGLEKSINLIKDTYNFNKLNNMANNLRFYPIS